MEFEHALTGNDTRMCKNHYQENVALWGTFARDDFILSPPSESKLLDTNLRSQSGQWYKMRYLQTIGSL